MADQPGTLDRISRIHQKPVARGIIKDHEVYDWADAEGCRRYYAGTRQNCERNFQNGLKPA
jgi:hypothetical protein